MNLQKKKSRVTLLITTQLEWESTPENVKLRPLFSTWKRTRKSFNYPETNAMKKNISN